MDPYGLHWFRRDLRIAGNPALQWGHKEHNGRVLGFFCFDSKFLSRPDFSADRFGFFLKTMRVLRDELREGGGDLLVLDIGPEQAFERLFEMLRKHGRELPASISFNRDYEPFARKRDQRISEILEAKGVHVHHERDHLIVEPHELKPGTKAPYYQVYSPFGRKWFDTVSAESDRVTRQRHAINYLNQRKAGALPRLFSLTWPKLISTELSDKLDEYTEKNSPLVTVPLPDAGSSAALDRVREFKREALVAYHEGRDIPSIDGTSRLSIYLKNGSITSAMVFSELELLKGAFAIKDGRSTFAREIAWREFYYHLLFHVPRVEHEAFVERYKALEWRGEPEHLDAWKEGRTGYPIVDAGMRQLKTTGWMHNRVRMIVASFLTKDLLLNWQEGERYFMEKLLDGDLAPNNGGWQWAASTGSDPQPYFRIFNPKLQSEKFDPEGIYIKAFVPELRDVPAKKIHDPEKFGKVKGYPLPIVDHGIQKKAALAMYTGL